MAQVSAEVVLRQLRKGIDTSSPGVSDGELLERFVERRDEAVTSRWPTSFRREP